MPKKRPRLGSEKQKRYGTSTRKGKKFNTRNLRNMFKSVGTQTDREYFSSYVAANANCVSTQTGSELFERAPSRAGTYTAQDRTVDECVQARQHLNNAIPTGFHWTSLMILVVLRFIYYAVVELQWSWNASCHQAGVIFKLKRQTVQTMGKLHRESVLSANPSELPPELSRKVSGRGSEAFKNGEFSENFKVLKEHHLKEVLKYVRERNRSMSGICTVRSIQAHLIHKYGIKFKYYTIRYGLANRLELKYRTTFGKRLIFTPQRIILADTFCEKLNAALIEERAGNTVIVYMDETYCHQHHMPSSAWQEDESADGAVRCERTRSKGSMLIILHALSKHGLLFKTNRHGERPEPDEWQGGKVLTTEMIFQSKKARGDYHENMNGTMFLKWLKNRLFPTFKALYGRRKLVLVLDNAPYHHVHPEDSFFATGKSKVEIKVKLQQLGVQRIKVKPYVGEEQQCQPPVCSPLTPWFEYEQWVLVESTTGRAYLIDGVSDQGYGDAVVYVRVTKKKLGTVESTLVDDFRRLLADDFNLVGRGPAAIRYVRRIMTDQAKVPSRLRTRSQHMRTQCRQYTEQCVDTKFAYRTRDLDANYNGAGEKGTGGPKTEWLRPAVDAYIAKYHPKLHQTKVMRLFDRLGYELIFTVPYWAKSQPAELAWAYDKNYVGQQYHPGRSMKQLRDHVKQGFYGGPKQDGGRHAGIDSNLASSFIRHTHKFINEYIQSSEKLKDTGMVIEL